MPFNNAISYQANGTIGPCLFVKMDTTAGASHDEQVLQATDGSGSHGDPTVGISQEGMKRPPGLPGSDTTIAAEAGDTLRVYGPGDDCLLLLGGTVTHGDLLKSDANGKGITASSDGDNVGARALQSGTSGMKIRVQVQQFQRGA